MPGPAAIAKPAGARLRRHQAGRILHAVPDEHAGPCIGAKSGESSTLSKMQLAMSATSFRDWGKAASTVSGYAATMGVLWPRISRPASAKTWGALAAMQPRRSHDGRRSGTPRQTRRRRPGSGRDHFSEANRCPRLMARSDRPRIRHPRSGAAHWGGRRGGVTDFGVHRSRGHGTTAATCARRLDIS